MSSSAGRDSDDDEGPPPLPPLAANAQQPSPVPPHAPLGYSNVVKLLRHIRRPELLSSFTNEEVNDELLPFVDSDSFTSLGLTQAEVDCAASFRNSGYIDISPDATVEDAGDSWLTSDVASTAVPAERLPPSPAFVKDPPPTVPPSLKSAAPITFAGQSASAIRHLAVLLQNACRCSAARRALALRASLYDLLLASTADIQAQSQKCLAVLARTARLQRKCEDHNMELTAHLDLNLKSSSGFLADVSFPVLFGSLQPLAAAWKAVEIKISSFSTASSLPALLKWWRRLFDPKDGQGPSLGHAILHALQLSAAHTSTLIMRGGPLWAWLFKSRPGVASFMSIALRTLSDVEEDIFAMIASPMHAMAGVCSQLVSLCDLGALSFDFVISTSAIMQTVQNQLEVFLSYPPSFSAVAMLKLSWVQVSKVSFVMPIPPPPGLLSSPPLSSAVSTASFVPDCMAVVVVIDGDIRVVFPCWPWVLQLPVADAALDVDSGGCSESSSVALLNLNGVGTLHLMFYSKVLEKSWADILNKDRVLRASSSGEEADWKISCSIMDTEQRSDLIREYTAYVIKVTLGRMEWVVSRRYSDFEQLTKQFQKELPVWAFNQLLQLPSAKSVGQNLSKNSFAVVEKRRIQLELYLVDVCSRRVACKSNCFRKFLDFQSHFHELDDSKSNASIDSSPATSPPTLSLRGAAAAVLVSVSTAGRRASLSLSKIKDPQPSDSSQTSEPHTGSPHISRMTSIRRVEATEQTKPILTEPAMYSVLYKRGGFHNAGFLHKSSWKNKAVAIWRGLLAYWPAAEEDKTRLEPLHQIGNPTSVVNLVGARITKFSERPNSFEIHVSNGVITFSAHSSDMFAAWLSCLVSCIVPPSETFTSPSISVLLGLASAPSSVLFGSPTALPGDTAATGVEPPNGVKTESIPSWFCFPLSSAQVKSDIGQLLLLVAAVQAALEDASPAILSSLSEALAEIDGETYSALRSVATGRSTPDASWIRLKAFVSEPKQNLFQQLLSRVGAISVAQLQQHYALTSASCAYGVAVEAAAVLVCVRAYLDEQGQPLLLPDDCDAPQLAHPAPIVEFIRALLNLSFLSFPFIEPSSEADFSDDAGYMGKRSSLTPVDARVKSVVVATLAASRDDNQRSWLISGDSKRNSLITTASKRTSVRTSLPSPVASSNSTTPILSFLASSMCRSTHGMFAVGAGGHDSVGRKVESLALLRSKLMQLAPPPVPSIIREISTSSADGASDSAPSVDVLWTEDDGSVHSSIYCATVERLVAFITDPSAMGDIYSQKVFLLTYRSFVQPIDLLRLLEQRLLCTDLSTADRFVVQSRIMAMLKTWCQRFFVFGDFDDAAFSESFFDLLDKFEGIHAMQRVAVALKTDLLSRIENRESGIISVVGTPPPIIYPHDKFTAYYKFDKTFRLQMWPTEEVARQFSLYEFAIFRKIQPKEMLNQAWSKKTRHEFAPNVTADISHFNVISSLAAYSVVSVPDLQQRQRMLKHTWNGVREQEDTDYTRLAQEYSRDNNYDALRTIHSSAPPPIVPFLGMYLSDITFIDEGNANTVQGLVNWKKRQMLSDVIENIAIMQQMQYPVPELQKIISEVRLRGEDECYALSVKHEPRDA